MDSEITVVFSSWIAPSMFWRDGVDSLSTQLVISAGLGISNLLVLEGQPSATRKSPSNMDTQHMDAEAVGCGALDIWTLRQARLQ